MIHFKRAVKLAEYFNMLLTTNEYILRCVQAQKSNLEPR